MKPDKKPDNPLVFPLRDPASRTEAQNQGLTLLNYFIAHAPPTPQWDFDVPMVTERPKQIYAIGDNPNFSIPTNENEIHKWEKEKRIIKAKMWASEWAKVQLEGKN